MSQKHDPEIAESQRELADEKVRELALELGHSLGLLAPDVLLLILSSAMGGVYYLGPLTARDLLISMAEAATCDRKDAASVERSMAGVMDAGLAWRYEAMRPSADRKANPE